MSRPSFVRGLNYRYFFLAAIILFVSILRLYGLSHNDLWYDEATTYLATKYNLREDSFLYYSFLKLWFVIFPKTAFFFRLPSAILSIFSLIYFSSFLKKYFSLRICFWATILMGLSAFQIWYAQEARSYVMVLFLGLISTGLLYEILYVRRDNISTAIFAFVSVLGVYAHPTYIILFFCHLVILLMNGRRSSGLFFSPISILIYLFLIPRIYFLSLIYRYHNAGFWLPMPQWSAIFNTLDNFLIGYNGSQAVYLTGRIVILIILSRLFFILVKRKCVHPVFDLFFFLFIFALGAAFMFSKYCIPIYLDRCLIFVSPFFYLGLAVGIDTMRPAFVRIFMGLVLIALQILGLTAYYKMEMPASYQRHIGIVAKKSYKPAVDFLLKNINREDVVVFSNVATMPSFYYYGVRDYKTRILYDPKYLLETRRLSYATLENSMPLKDLSRKSGSVYWLVACDWERSGDLTRHPNSLSVKRYLDNNYILQMGRNFDGLFVYKYVAG